MGKKKLLIVEDEIALLKVLTIKFEKEGFAVFGAKDGEEGLATAIKERPDMILLDIIMPKMDGLTMLRELRKDAWGRDAKVMILTNLNESTAVEASLKSGVFDFLIKTNWSLDEVVERVQHSLSTTE